MSLKNIYQKSVDRFLLLFCYFIGAYALIYLLKIVITIGFGNNISTNIIIKFFLTMAKTTILTLIISLVYLKNFRESDHILTNEVKKNG